jgi:hypothetical protein
MYNLHGESNDFEAQTETCPLSTSNTHAGADGIQDSEYDSGEDGEGSYLIKGESALGNKDSGGGNNETLNQIFNNAVNNFSESVAHHFYI